MSNYVFCPICGKGFRVLSNTHFRYRHGQNIQVWRKGFKGSLWGTQALRKLTGNNHALGNKHTEAFKKRFRAAVSKPMPEAVKRKIRNTHLKLMKTARRQALVKKMLEASAKARSHAKADLLRLSREWLDRHPGVGATELKNAHRGWGKAVKKHFGSWAQLLERGIA